MNTFSYDKHADVLYFSINRPEPCDCIEEDGLLWRYSLKTNELVALTIIDFKRHDRQHLIDEMVLKFRLDKDEVKSMLELYDVS